MHANIKLLLVLLMSVTTTAAMADWPTIEPPPGARVETVAEDMHLNGVPMRIKRFTSDMSPRAVADFYQGRWTAVSKFKPVENDVQGWHVIGVQSGDYYLTVQTRSAAPRGSEGYLAVTTLPSLRERPVVDQKFPRLAGSQVLSDMDADDAGKISKTLVLKNNSSVVSNVSYYQSIMPSQDWKQNMSYGGPQHNGDAYAMYFERRKEAANIVVRKDPKGGTVVVINIVSTSI